MSDRHDDLRLIDPVIADAMHETVVSEVMLDFNAAWAKLEATTDRRLRDVVASDAEVDRLRAVLTEIADDDPDDGCRLGHAEQAKAALEVR